jgi:hypothetical protein
MSNEIHVDDVGSKLLITVYDNDEVVDISDAVVLNIFIKKPDGVLLTKYATLENDGTDGKMYYLTEDGDLDIAGNYKIQGKVVITGGTYYTSTGTFKVHCNL